jgi:hypothetical protein
MVIRFSWFASAAKRAEAAFAALVRWHAAMVFGV